MVTLQRLDQTLLEPSSGFTAVELFTSAGGAPFLFRLGNRIRVFWGEPRHIPLEYSVKNVGSSSFAWERPITGIYVRTFIRFASTD